MSTQDDIVADLEKALEEFRRAMAQMNRAACGLALAIEHAQLPVSAQDDVWKRVVDFSEDSFIAQRLRGLAWPA
jgi:hypothetical protein